MGTAIFGDLPGPLPDPSLAGQVLTWNGERWDLSTGAELSIALADLSDVSGTSGSGSTVPFTTSPTFTTPRIVTSINDLAGAKLIEFVPGATAIAHLQVFSGTAGLPVGLRTSDGAAVFPLTITAAATTVTVASVDFVTPSASVNGEVIETQNNKNAANGYLGADANARLASNKIQVSATDRLIGRDTAAAGASEELTVTGGLEFTGTGIQRSALTGDITASAGSNATTLSAAATAGKLKSFQILTSGTTYTRPAGIVSILVEAISGGGGGGGAAQAAASAAAGGGGGAGSYAREWFAAAASSYTYAIGAAGAGGTAGNNNGTQGGATSFSTVATIGGAGGAGSPAGTVVAVATGGAGGGVATGADINGGGAPGGFGLTFTGTVAASGFGGSGHFGGGAGAATTERAGFAAAAYGSGGSGGCCLGGTARAGGVGFAGVVYVWEFS